MIPAADDLISKAQAGDGDAFRALTEPHRRELQVHCYRMLGSLQDAEDAMQDTLLAAWASIGGFERRSSLRTWLYQIATNRCLNARRSAGRRLAKEWDVPKVEPPEPTRLGEVTWLEPYPDALLDGAVDGPPGPEARYEQTESISLAFVTALQVLPPRQLAVLILRDVLGFHAKEVGEMLGATTESVNSALKRARASLERRPATATGHEPPPVCDSAAEEAVVSMFAASVGVRRCRRARGSPDRRCVRVDAADAFRIRGLRCRSAFCASIFASGRRFNLVPTRANGQPAFGAYVRADDGFSYSAGLFVLGLAGDRICAMTRFENTMLPWFGLSAIPSNPVNR